MPDHPYGWLSVAPPLVTVVVAIVTKRVLSSLLVGLLAGALITRGGDPVAAVYDVLEMQLWPTLVDPFKLRVLMFTLAMGAMIGVVHAGGGMQGLVNLVTPVTHTRRRGQLACWVLGLAVFFDDYTNSLILGSTMRATFDRLRISREKLAYIVDSTAAPIAGIVPLSVWVAIELDYINEGLSQAGEPYSSQLSPMDLFIACIPYRFYVIQALVLVPMVVLLRRDLGPMAAAERRAREADDAEPARDADSAPPSPEPTHWSNAAAPILVTLGVVLALIVATGRAALAAQGASEPTMRDVFGAARSEVALLYGALAGLATAAVMARMRGVLSAHGVRDAAFAGARTVVPALAILWFAGALSSMTGNTGLEGQASSAPYEFREFRLYTGDYLKTLLPTSDEAGAGAVAALLPAAVFLLSCFIAFSTGTSFGTMGIVLPFVVPISLATVTAADGSFDAHHPLLLASIGSVLAGAIFGDHCSPISDTTILSSQASGCDHIAHVVTQMPYALLAGAVSCGGVLAVGLGVNVWILLPAQTAAMAGLLLVLGRREQAEPE